LTKNVNMMQQLYLHYRVCIITILHLTDKKNFKGELGKAMLFFDGSIAKMDIFSKTYFPKQECVRICTRVKMLSQSYL